MLRTDDSTTGAKGVYAGITDVEARELMRYLEVLREERNKDSLWTFQRERQTLRDAWEEAEIIAKRSIEKRQEAERYAGALYVKLAKAEHAEQSCITVKTELFARIEKLEQQLTEQRERFEAQLEVYREAHRQPTGD